MKDGAVGTGKGRVVGALKGLAVGTEKGSSFPQ